MPAHYFRPGSCRWLSSMGHPGYGRSFAAGVWAWVEATYGEATFLAADAGRQSAMVWAGVRAGRRYESDAIVGAGA